MRNTVTLGVAAIVLGFGIAEAAAATVEPEALVNGTPGQSILVPPPGQPNGGLSAIRAHKGASVQKKGFIELPTTGYAIPENLTRPDDGHAWRSGVAALSPALPGVNDAVQSTAVQAPQGFTRSKSGLSAIKGKSDASGAGLVAAPSAGESPVAGLQRPEGSNWSDRGRESLRPDTVAPVPPGPSVK